MSRYPLICPRCNAEGELRISIIFLFSGHIYQCQDCKLHSRRNESEKHTREMLIERARSTLDGPHFCKHDVTRTYIAPRRNLTLTGNHVPIESSFVPVVFRKEWYATKDKEWCEWVLDNEPKFELDWHDE